MDNTNTNNKKAEASICMATFNGEKFIHKQIKSILTNMKEEDELIVSDDNSKDSTLDIIKSFDDSRIKLFLNSKAGVINNFQNAIQRASGKIIFLSDQDDVWMDNKRDVIFNHLKNSSSAACLTDCNLIDGNDSIIAESFYPIKKSGPGFFKNIYRNTFLGCAMAFKKEVLMAALPFPEKIYMHDEWIGLIASLCGNVDFLPDKCFSYRRHGNNVSSMSNGTIGFMAGKRISHLILAASRLKEIERAKYHISKNFKEGKS
jgi:glycosyltransferase involved in cell wall biosynthesis